MILGWGLAQEIKPVAVSPGSERGVARVSERCPTFSWSAVGWATGYKIAVFEAQTAEVRTYESMALAATPVLTQDIPGKALSWTPSEGQGLRDGGLYVWYVQARDASGNGLWSSGKAFMVEVEKTPLLGVDERVARKLRTRGVSGDVIAEAEKEIRGGARGRAISRGFTLKPQDRTSPGILAGNDHQASGWVKDQGSEDGGGANVYYGLGAGTSLTASSSLNSFFGYSAGHLTDWGDLNTFIGYYAGRDNSTGGGNTFLGGYAGTNNTTGYSNTFLGEDAGRCTTIGCVNTFVGREAGYANSTGSYNTSVGFYAGANSSTGNYNTMIGYYAGYANTASSNTFLGYNSGRANTAGTYNTFFGQNAGRFNTTGSNNVYLGLNSASNNIIGGNNVVIGVNAGFSDTGSGNVFLGYRAGYSETGSNKLYIDNYSDTFPLIYGDFGTGKVGINGYLGVGVQSPGYRIQVAGGAYCNGTTWTDASSRSLKENIRALAAEDAQEALAQLAPVRFNYKTDATEECLGFIAEDVPSLVATGDRKGMSPMDVVAVLTRVVQEQQATIDELREGLKAVDELRREIEALKKNSK